MKNEYAELKQLVKQRGLLEKQTSYYAYKAPLTLGLLALGLILFLVLPNNFWLKLLDAIYLAFAFTQVALIGHDAGHRQIFRATWQNDALGLIDSLLVGMSYSWWINKHNRHHSHPNEVDADPDIDIPLISFTEGQAQKKQTIGRFVTKYQAYFYIPMFTLLPFTMRFAGFQFLLRKKGRHLLIEATFMVMSLMLYFAFLLTRLPVWQAVLFFFFQQMLFGLYLGSIFASNHKGMLILERESQIDFLRKQVLTSRDVKGNPFTDFWYGGLNYQIEHHLFPNMARNKLKEAQVIVKSFCNARSIPYCETTVFQSFCEVHQFLHSIGAPMRGKASELDRHGIAR
jgi:fatty acid desaturase